MTAPHHWTQAEPTTPPPRSDYLPHADWRIVDALQYYRTLKIMPNAQSRLDDPRAKRQPWLRTPLDGPILLLLVQLAVSFWASALPDSEMMMGCSISAASQTAAMR